MFDPSRFPKSDKSVARSNGASSRKIENCHRLYAYVTRKKSTVNTRLYLPKACQTFASQEAGVPRLIKFLLAINCVGDVENAEGTATHVIAVMTKWPSLWFSAGIA